MDVELYLRRIGVEGKVVPDFNNLRMLQSKHMLHVPFENIDIYYGIPIEFSVEAFYKKIVTKRRGGYCYELNGLFHCLLTSLGYEATLISALVTDKRDFITEYEHMAIVVELDGSKWLVDVGYGDSSLVPIQLSPEKIQDDGLSHYRIAENIVVDGKVRMSLEKYNDKQHSFAPLYYFTLGARSLNSFMIMHEYQEVVPNAHYKRAFICSVATEDGRISIINDRLIETRGGDRQIKSVRNREEQDNLLRRFFDIDLSSGSFPRTNSGLKETPLRLSNGVYSSI